MAPLATRREHPYEKRMTRTVFMYLAWSALLAVAIVTLSPIGMRPRLPMPVDLERAAAYLAVGLLFALAYPRHVWLALAIVVVGLLGLEWLQGLRPDRHARLGDAMVKGAGALLGLGAGWLLVVFYERVNRKNGSTGKLTAKRVLSQ
jgi:hypothetical protein